ncbi:MAG TPA: translation initiation factor IF-2 [Myxococcota bacterium]|nr:translation initiation factor IF-2 [Myxococcota bacterium]HRY92309.1 translation initiation factor IF-2 [Myxococcota bacterium]
MTKVRVYEIAKDLGMESKALLERLVELGYDVKSHASALDESEARLIVEKFWAEKKDVDEKRIGTRVIRRRSKPEEAAPVVEAAPQPEGQEAPPAGEQPAPEAAPDEASADEVQGTAQDAPAEAGPLPSPEPGVEAPEAPAPDAAAEQPAAAAESPPAATPAPRADGFVPATIVRRAVVPPRYQATVVSRPAAGAAADPNKPSGVRVLKVIPGKEGRANQFIDLGKPDKNKRKQAARVEQADIKEAINDAFTPGFTPAMSRRRRLARRKGGARTSTAAPSKALKRIIKLETATILASELGKRMGVKLRAINAKLRDMGDETIELREDRSLDLAAATTLAHEFGFEVQDVSFKESEVLASGEDRPEELVVRSPVVTVMGHVDHGKTSILDAIRKTKVAEGEFGGITQHIGAYEVTTPKGTISFIDTPGHEAFTAMRARGASLTDIVVLVVAADDGIMPQTVEAIHHAKDAGVPIIVAINKMDLPGANPDRITQDLTKHGLVPEAWGGDTIVVQVSAKTKEGLENLLDSILLQAEVMELRGNPEKPASGVVVEARLDRGRGPVATLLVKNGTLRKGDYLVVGMTDGRVRALYDFEGQSRDEVGPGRPVLVQGLAEVPAAGDSFNAVKNEREAKKLLVHREEEATASKGDQSARLSLEDFYEQLRGAEKLELKVLVKADVQGSAEAVRQALEKMASPKVGIKVIHAGVGAISETDVNLAKASGAVLVGFNIRPDPNAKRQADQQGLEIRTYNIIYDLTDDIRKAQTGLLPATLKENVVGRAEVRDLFTVPKVGVVAGVAVTEGKLMRSAQIRLLRDAVEVWKGKLSSLKRFKDDTREVPQGMECGCGLDGFNDIKRGDVLEAFVVEEIRPSL